MQALCFLGPVYRIRMRIAFAVTAAVRPVGETGWEYGRPQERKRSVGSG